jgi:anti-anti-sigma regulatory factor
VTTKRRTVVVDLSDVMVRRTNVIAVLVGAAREARTTGSCVQVYGAPVDGRRALFVAGIDEVPALTEPSYEIIVGVAALHETAPVAV